MNDLEQSAANAERALDAGGLPIRQVLTTLVQNRVPLREFRDWQTRAYVMEVLRQARGNQSEAARIAGMHRNSFCALMHKLRITTAGERRDERREQRRRSLGLRE
jgi:DNA-binding NtrC family response regulator